MARGARIGRSKVDFGLPTRQLADELGCSLPAVYNARKNASVVQQSLTVDSPKIA